MTEGPWKDWLGSSDFVDISLSQPTYHGTTELQLCRWAVDDGAKDFFGAAFCHWLAAAIATRSGWQVATVDHDDGNGGWEPAHSVVITPDGTAVDIFGEHPSIETVKDWFSSQGKRRARHRIVPVEHMPGDTVSNLDHLRGDPNWWAADFGDNAWIIRHFAGHMLRTTGHGDPPVSLPPPPPIPATDTPPAPAPDPAPSTTSTGGTAMGIDEIRAAIAETQQRGEGAATQLTAIRNELEGATALLMQITQGSSDPSVTEAVGQLQTVTDELDQLTPRIHSATETAQAYAARL